MLLRVVLLLVLAIVLARFLVRLAGLATAALREGNTPGAAPAPPSVPLVACRRCGVFVPRAEAAAVSADGVLCRACAGG
jgi:hypothetical protein